MLKISRQFQKIFPKKFGNFWNDIEDYSKIDNDLVEITNSFINTAEILIDDPACTDSHVPNFGVAHLSFG